MKNLTIYLSITIFFLFFMPLFLYAAKASTTVTLEWEPNPEPYPDGYKVFYRKENQSFDYTQPIWKGKTPTCTLDNLEDQTSYYFVVRAYTDNGVESGNSNQVFYSTGVNEKPNEWFLDEDQPPPNDSLPADQDPPFSDASPEGLDSTDNRPPDQPVIIYPQDNELNVQLTPELVSGEFIDPDHIDLHIKSQWRIIEKDNNIYVFDITTDKRLTELIVPLLILEENRVYQWSVRFFDSYGNVSEWATPHTFRTIQSTQETENPPIATEESELEFGQETGEELETADTPATDDDNISDGENQEPDMSDNSEANRIFVVNAVTGQGQIRIDLDECTHVKSIDRINSIDPGIISNSSSIPDNMTLGLIVFKLKLEQPGDTAIVPIHFSQQAPPDVNWIKYDSVIGWQDYSDHSTFADDRMSVILEIKDGGFGDTDGAENGIIVDPSGFGTASYEFYLNQVANSSAGASATESGCFIYTIPRLPRK